MSSNLIEAKQALCGCTCKSQVMAVVDAFCDKTRFSYSADLSLMDNATIASRQDKHKVSEVLSFAAKQWGGYERQTTRSQNHKNRRN